MLFLPTAHIVLTIPVPLVTQAILCLHMGSSVVVDSEEQSSIQLDYIEIHLLGTEALLATLTR